MAVRSRLKQFETQSDEDKMAGIVKPKPPISSKPGYGKNINPALQKFMDKQNEASENSTETKPTITPVAAKWGKPAGNTVLEEKNENKNETNWVGVQRQSSTGGKLDVPMAFQKDSVNSSNTGHPASAHNSIVEANKFKFQAKPNVGVRPTTALKPPPNSLKSETAPPVAPKTDSAPSVPTKSESAITNEDKKEAHVSKNSIASRILQLTQDNQVDSKTNSVISSSSSSSSQSATSPTTSNTNESGTFDFKSQLRSTKGPLTSGQPPTKKPVHLPNILPKPGGVRSPPMSPTSSQPQGKIGAAKLKRVNDSTIKERKSDNKKFKELKLEALSPSAQPPAKPSLPKDEIDLSSIQQEYEKTLKSLDGTAVNGCEEDPDIIYDDCSSLTDVKLRQVTPRQSENKRISDRVSMIPEMSSEDEGGNDDNTDEIYDDGYTQQQQAPAPAQAPELYEVAGTEDKISEDAGEIYADEESIALSNVAQESEEDKKKRMKEEAEAKKKEERERKEEEKRKKKEEKEKANKLKEEIKLKKKFNLTGDEVSIGEGVIRQDVKGWGFGPTLKQGQIVTIVRVDNNPPNKWLVKTDCGMGYVDSSNIDMEPVVIRQAMGSLPRTDSTVDADVDDDQPNYDDVPQEEDIYQECP